MLIALFVLSLIDFTIGLTFGNIGYFFSILVFPLIAVIRGYLGINKGEKSYRNALFHTCIGAALFLLGLILGLIIFSSKLDENTIFHSLGKPSVGQALNLSIATSFIYALLYVVFGMLSAFLCKETSNVKKIYNQGKKNADKEI
jgi:ABC-type sulfate transport system permease subunit